MLSLFTRTVALRLAANRTATSPYFAVVPIRRSLLDAKPLVTALPYVPSGLRGYAELTDVPSEAATFPDEVKKPKRAVREMQKKKTAGSARKTARSEAAALKQKEKEAALKEKAAALKQKEKEAALKEKAAALKQKEKAKAAAEKEKKKAAALKEKAKAAAEKEKKKAAALLAKRKEAEKKQKLMPWEALGEDGKKLPHPTESRPRRPSAYMMYTMEIFPQLSKDPDLKSKLENTAGKDRLGVTATIIGKSWRASSETVKDKYRKMYRDGEAAYKQKLAQWESSLTPQDRKRIALYNRYIKAHPELKKHQTILAPVEGKPRKPLNAFMRFLNAYRRDHPTSLPGKEWVKEISVIWKGMSSSEKEPYESGYKSEHAAWQKAMEQWKQENAKL